MAEKKKSPAKASTDPRSDAEVLAEVNRAESAEELVKAAGLPKSRTAAAEALLSRRASLGRAAFTDMKELHEVVAANPDHAGILDAIRGADAPKPVKIPAERTHFTTLLLQNPNYFGNLPGSKLKPVKPQQGNTNFESLGCVGLNPPFDRLEAIVQVHSTSGYGGDVCTNGSHEFVRFYVDLHDDGVWHDVGFTQVRVHDIPGPKPICYAVSLDFEPSLKLCFNENIVKVRAILSWNSVPPAGAPNFVPVWGEAKDVEVVIRPRRFIVVDDFIELIPEDSPIHSVLAGMELDSLCGAIPVSPVSIAEKKKLYKAAKVPVGRYAFSEGLALTKAATSNVFEAPDSVQLQESGLTAAEVSELVKDLQILPVDGNQTYEELVCLGYDPGKSLLEATIHVKNKAGYSGSLCTHGSTEYVAFWANFGAGFTHLGTATVQVHDLNTLPRGGVHYSVFLKVDLSDYHIPCNLGARTPVVRAILSWQVAPPPGNPNFVPVWGNREQCRIQLRPGPAEAHIPLIETVGDIEREDIDQSTGLATGPMFISSGVANLSPFGGKVAITGRIGAPPDSFGGGQAPFKYRVRVSDDGGATWEVLGNKVNVGISEWLNGVPQECAPGDYTCSTSLTPVDDGDGLGGGWYTYLEDTIGPRTRALLLDKLADWYTGAREGLWRIELAAKDSTGTILGYDYRNVMLDNSRPSVAPPAANDPDAELRLAITSATFDGGTIPAVDCGKFPVGTLLEGTYAVSDPGVTHPGQHMGAFSLSLIPSGPAAGVTPDPSGKSFPVLATNGESGTWSIDTEGMASCGYVLRLVARDRTVVNSSGIGWWRSMDVGFCLIDPE